MRKLADCGGISPEGADIADNIRYLQDLADERDASPALYSGSRRQEKPVNQ